VLSLTPSMAEGAGRLLDIEGAREAAYVVVPFEPKGRRSLKAEERAEVLLESIRQLKGVGLRKVLADPLLDPPVAPGCLEGLKACQLLRARAPGVPIILGAGNITELIDADSHGVNALLASLAIEAGASAILTTEGSVKTRGCVEEAVKAAKMASLARARGTPPKDLGIDLLVVKEKRRRGVSVELPPKVVEASGAEEPRRDPLGSFRLGVDEERGLLIAIHYPPGSTAPSLAVVARRALEVRDALIKHRLVSDLKHAFYLGYELAKAEVALKLKKSYLQDEHVV
ncbi:MAG: dihydropteroate synthase-like protein, partial [Candidatus Nezhaarchaeota archaeon]|nr:dihydropteroate synthase-like protein [Candidatus Nezhaarchaeota archaeon]